MAGIFFLLKDFFSMFIIGLRFLLDLLTKDTGRSDHENNDQHKEYNCVTIAVCNQNAERFDQSNQDAADNSAFDAAETAEDDTGECLLRHGAEGLGNQEQRRGQPAADTGQAHTYHIGAGNCDNCGNTNQIGGVAILCGCLHDLADKGLFKQDINAQHQAAANDQDQNILVIEISRTNMGHTVNDGIHRQRNRAPDQANDFFQGNGCAQCGNRDRNLPRRGPQRPVHSKHIGRAANCETHQSADRDTPYWQMQLVCKHPREVSAQHKKLPVGKIQNTNRLNDQN